MHSDQEQTLTMVSETDLSEAESIVSASSVPNQTTTPQIRRRTRSEVKGESQPKRGASAKKIFKQFNLRETPLPDSIHDLAEFARKQVLGILRDNTTNLSTELFNRLQGVQRLLFQLQEKGIEQEAYSQKLEAIIEEKKILQAESTQQLEFARNQALSPETIQRLIEENLATHTRQLEQMEPVLNQLLGRIQQTPKISPEAAATNHVLPVNMQSATQINPHPTAPSSVTQANPHPTAPSYSSAATDALKRSLIVRSKDNTTTGNQVWEHLKTTNLTLPLSAIEKVFVRRNHLEVRCRTAGEKSVIKTDLQQNQGMRDFIILDKAHRKQKIILIGVPNIIEASSLKDSICSTLRQ